MGFSDLIIIYLACGAPLAVLTFVQNRRVLSPGALFLQTFLTLLFWIPTAVRLVARTGFLTNLYNQHFDRDHQLDASRDAKVEETRKYVEGFASEPRLGLSVFELREVFDRYVGLSCELRDARNSKGTPENELFAISGHPNRPIGDECLRRKNMQRLAFHQEMAVRDFRRLVAKLTEVASDKEFAIAVFRELGEVIGDQGLVESVANRRQVLAGQDESWTTEDLRSQKKHDRTALPQLTAMKLSIKD